MTKLIYHSIIIHREADLLTIFLEDNNITMFVLISLALGLLAMIASAIVLFNRHDERFSRVDVYSAVVAVIALLLSFILVELGHRPTALVMVGTTLASFNFFQACVAQASTSPFII